MSGLLDYLPYILYVVSFICGTIAGHLINEYYGEVDSFWRTYDDLS
jgi:hypothetical protein